MRNDLFSLREEKSLEVEKEAISSVKSELHEPAMELMAAKKAETNPSLGVTQDLSNNLPAQSNSQSNTQEKVRVRTLNGPRPMHSVPPVVENTSEPIRAVSTDEWASPSDNFLGQNNQMGSSTMTVLILIAGVVLMSMVAFFTFIILDGLGF